MMMTACSRENSGRLSLDAHRRQEANRRASLVSHVSRPHDAKTPATPENQSLDERQSEGRRGGEAAENPGSREDVRK